MVTKRVKKYDKMMTHQWPYNLCNKNKKEQEKHGVLEKKTHGKQLTKPKANKPQLSWTKQLLMKGDKESHQVISNMWSTP